MKRFILLLGFLCGFAFSTSHAETTLTLEGVTVQPGDTAFINLALNNSVPVVGFQFVITPSPAGDITFSQITAIGRIEGWTVGANISGGGLIVVGYSATGASVDAGSDVILTLKYYVSENASKQTISLQISGAKVSDANLSPITDLSVINGSITIAGNKEPTASFTTKPESGNPPLTVQFDASASNDPDGTIAAYAWDFGDGTTSTGVTASHTYENTGNYTISLTVTDNEGATKISSRKVLVYPSGVYERGDVNRDGKTDIFDLLELLKILGS
ncbi:MAG TPA: PKD domain-containing protein [archaeon]|nr:PKD domain-containing protein [archaeon]